MRSGTIRIKDFCQGHGFVFSYSLLAHTGSLSWLFLSLKGNCKLLHDVTSVAIPNKRSLQNATIRAHPPPPPKMCTHTNHHHLPQPSSWCWWLEHGLLYFGPQPLPLVFVWCLQPLSCLSKSGIFTIYSGGQTASWSCLRFGMVYVLKPCRNSKFTFKQSLSGDLLHTSCGLFCSLIAMQSHWPPSCLWDESSASHWHWPWSWSQLSHGLGMDPVFLVKFNLVSLSKLQESLIQHSYTLICHRYSFFL